MLDKQQHSGYIRVLIYSLSNAALSGDISGLCSFSVKADENADGTAQIKLQSIAASAQIGVTVPLDNVESTVTISRPIASSVTLTPTSALLKVGEQQQFAATVLPANVADKDVSWSIDNTTVATVDESGLVHAVG